MVTKIDYIETLSIYICCNTIEKTNGNIAFIWTVLSGGVFEKNLV